jgi:hypothetical protein
VAAADIAAAVVAVDTVTAAATVAATKLGTQQTSKGRLRAPFPFVPDEAVSADR